MTEIGGRLSWRPHVVYILWCSASSFIMAITAPMFICYWPLAGPDDGDSDSVEFYGSYGSDFGCSTVICRSPQYGLFFILYLPISLFLFPTLGGMRSSVVEFGLRFVTGLPRSRAPQVRPHYKPNRLYRIVLTAVSAAAFQYQMLVGTCQLPLVRVDRLTTGEDRQFSGST